MNNKAIAKIIIWSIVAIILIGVLIYFMFKPFNLKGISLGNIKFNYANSEKYSIGNGSVSGKDINEIEINWISGKIKVIPYDGDEIIFNESSKLMISEDDQLRYLNENGKLIIQFYKPRGFGGFFSQTLSKSLEVSVPRELAKSLVTLDISNVSSAIDVSDISAEEIYINNVSGGTNLQNITCTLLKIDTVSGGISCNSLTASKIESDSVSANIKLEGSIDSIDHESVSGSLTFEGIKCPDSIDCQTISGKASVTIPDNDGFTAMLDSVSGKITCDFAAISKKDRIIYKDGNAKFDFESVSGNVYIYKK